MSNTHPDSNHDNPTTAPAPAPAPAAADAGGGFGLRLVILVMACVLVGLIAFQAGKAALPKPDTDRIRLITGIGRSVTNQLDSRYTDANNDLIADLPADPAAIIDPDPIVFSYIASPDADDELTGWGDFVEHLAATTGRRVEHRVFTDRTKQLRALRNGQLHVTGLNTGGVPIAVNAAGFVPVVTPGTQGRATSYKMLVIVPANSPIQRVADLAGKQIAFTTPSSNSGYKAPLVILESDFDLRVERDYYIINSFSHAASIAGVASGQYAAAVTASDLLQRAIEQGDISEGAVRVIYESEPFPTAALGFAYNLAPDIQRAVTEAFETFDFAGTSLAAYFQGQHATGFLPMNYKDEFSLIRRIDDAIGFEHTIPDADTSSDTAPSPDEDA